MIYDLVDLSDWKKKPQILKELKVSGIYMSERKFRRMVEDNNKLYAEHVTKYFVAHSYKGYIATNDRNIIIDSLLNNQKRAKTMFISASKTLKALGENNNMNLEVE